MLDLSVWIHAECLFQYWHLVSTQTLAAINTVTLPWHHAHVVHLQRSSTSGCHYENSNSLFVLYTTSSFSDAFVFRGEWGISLNSPEKTASNIWLVELRGGLVNTGGGRTGGRGGSLWVGSPARPPPGVSQSPWSGWRGRGLKWDILWTRTGRLGGPVWSKLSTWCNVNGNKTWDLS